MNRIKVKRSKLLSSLVRGGADRRQMVRQLSRIHPDQEAGVDINLTTVNSAFLWKSTPQGVEYWAKIAKAYRG